MEGFSEQADDIALGHPGGALRHEDGGAGSLCRVAGGASAEPSTAKEAAVAVGKCAELSKCCGNCLRLGAE